MKKHVILMVVLAMALPLIAQENDEGREAAPDALTGNEQLNEKESGKGPAERGEQFKARQLKLMEKALDEIGVTEEQRARIFVLQEDHMAKMKANLTRLKAARKKLSRLQDAGSSMQEIEAAIDEVASAQAEQLRIFALNRREMEDILGKEKNDKFMENARDQFRRHGRRPGPDMPPRPGQTSAPAPPVPPVESDDIAPPPPIN